ncbi:DUF1128 domain-containing protein [Paenibacillus koleovorans]|uniref:DUF1128 domain-containing protein n=1 Tax=Paenibacillus koleovorans TaxID=121608 RepID=UPI000FDC314C|nr:DUF1128 domain-containing protein [Paenibacillus koleovorans]
MDLIQPSETNIAYMVEQIKTKLKVVTAASIKPEHFGIERYEDIRDIYDLIMSKKAFSISEIEALCAELKQLKEPV